MLRVSWTSEGALVPEDQIVRIVWGPLEDAGRPAHPKDVDLEGRALGHVMGLKIGQGQRPARAVPIGAGGDQAAGLAV